MSANARAPYRPSNSSKNTTSISAQQLTMNNKFSTAMKLAASLLLFFLCKAHAEAPSCSCESSSCTVASELECPSGTVLDPCGCCLVCAKTVGERCGSGSSACSEELLCIPDSPYSTSQEGTCQEATPCLTFGCDAVDGVCRCSYSNVCPLLYSYTTIEECEEDLQQIACENVECPPQESDCPEGMYYDPGFVVPGECCPKGAMCTCDYSQCPSSQSDSCPVGTVLVLTAPANVTARQCCDVFQCQPALPCSYGNESLSHGDKWNLDSCTTCECNNGALICLQEPCSIVSNCPSGRIFTPEGECCPVCSTECQASDGQIYSDGEIWRPGPCKRCRCDAGLTKCSSRQCQPPNCSNPIFLPDECCPVCPEPATSSCNFGDDIFANGDTWNDGACTTCHCFNGFVNCLQQACSMPNCPSGRTFTPEGECCPVCNTDCLASDGPIYSGEDGLIYSDGDTWREGPCKRCRCDAGLTKCTTVQCDHPNCSNPISLPDVCCPVCPEPATSSCNVNDDIFANGDTWKIDACSTCECSNGLVTCLQQPCSSVSNCPSGRTFTPEGECCPVCSTECEASDGLIYSDGDTWRESPCKRCRCDAGLTKCTTVQCDHLNCSNPIFLPDVCCPVCPEPATSSCNVDDDIFANGDTWKIDACTTCECSNGLVSCVQQPCSIPNCLSGRTFTPEGECCPVCSTECEASDGLIYSNGDTWRESPCKRCRCDAGLTKCTTVQCDHLDCSNPIFLPDVCCPICPDDEEPSQPSPSTAPEASTSPPSLTPEVNTEEVVLILEMPYVEYRNEERFLVAELKALLASEGLQLVDMKATPYKDSSETHIVMVLSLPDADAVGSTSEKVANIMDESAKFTGMAHIVGASSEDSKGGPTVVVSSIRDPNKDRDSYMIPLLSIVLGAAGFVAVVSLVGITIVAVIFIRRRRQKPKPEDDEKQ